MLGGSGCGCYGQRVWVIASGEQGKNARPMDPDWARGLRDQCAEAGVPFFVLQMADRQPIPLDLHVRQFPRVGGWRTQQAGHHHERHRIAAGRFPRAD